MNTWATQTQQYGGSSPPLTPLSATGAWNRPSVDLDQAVWEVKRPCRSIRIEGSVSLNTEFFRAPNGWEEDFSITIALTSPSSPSRPLDWNTDGSAPRNPSSLITIAPTGRITIDEELCVVSFSIEIPTSKSKFPFFPSGVGEAAAFGIRVKAFAVGPHSSGRVTASSEVPFVIVNRVPLGLAEKRKSIMMNRLKV